MGYNLYREVLDHAPADLKLAELVVWLVIADHANEETRLGYPGEELLMRRTRLKARALRDAFERLAARGYELRVPIGTDKNGRVFYAARGRRTTFRLPVLEGGTTTPPFGGSKAAPHNLLSEGKDGTVASERRHQTARKAAPQRPPSPQEPSENPHLSRAHIKALADLGATADEERRIIGQITQSNGDIKNMPAYLAAMARKGDLQPLLDRARIAGNPEQLRWLAYELRNGVRDAEEKVRAMFGERGLREATSDPGGWWRRYSSSGEDTEVSRAASANETQTA